MQGLEERIGYRFRDHALLERALTHPSLGKQANNQRLEFLGDAVLGLAVAGLLYRLYPGEQEGELARRHAALVRGGTLTEIAQELSLGEAMRLSASEAGAGGRNAASNLEDALEALIGAIYLDGGFDAAEAFIAPLWKARATTLNAPPKDAKTALQEWAQARGLPTPSYLITDQSGPAHAPQFVVTAIVGDHPPAEGSAPSKRAAEQAAAEKLLAILASI